MTRLKRSRKARWLFFFCFAPVLYASAQKTFKYEAKVQKVDSSGFYKISLSPEFIAKSNRDFSDIRIADKKGHFIPYITADDLPRPNTEKLIGFPEVTVKSKKDSGTTFIIENEAKIFTVNRLWLKLKNTAVQRTVNLSGSDDLMRWFAISEDIPLQTAELAGNGTYLQSITFPASNYHFLKLSVNDKNKAPLKFIGAGIFREDSLADQYFSIRGASILTRDSNKITYIKIHLNDNYLVNKITLDIGAPKYYKRDVSIYACEGGKFHQVNTAELSPNKTGGLLIDAKTNKLELQIYNGDNLPLTINRINVAQADQYIVAYLEAGKAYRLLTGDSKAATQDYDLKFFTDSLHSRLPEIIHSPVAKNALYNSNIPSPKVKKEYKAWIWVAIVLAVLLLTLLTARMAGEVKKRA
jgi:hypothetical protein